MGFSISYPFFLEGEFREYVKKSLEGMFRKVECDRRKNLLESIMYECECRTVDLKFGYLS